MRLPAMPHSQALLRRLRFCGRRPVPLGQSLCVSLAILVPIRNYSNLADEECRKGEHLFTELFQRSGEAFLVRIRGGSLPCCRPRKFTVLEGVTAR